MNWRKLNKELNLYSEEQVLQMLNEERVGARRAYCVPKILSPASPKPGRM